MPPKSICFVAGEPSGDLHGSLLITEIKKRHPDWTLWGVGCDKMAAAGCELWRDARDWAVMGFAEVFKSLWKLRRRLHALTVEIKRRHPDGLILIDYPGFNLKLAAHAHRASIGVLYYIVPQIWAWGERRVETFRRYVDRTVVVFPFEQEFFARHEVAAEWVGHPLVDIVHPSTDRDTLRRSLGVASGEKLVALMPGVRVQDFHTHLPLFSKTLRLVAESIPRVRGVIGVSGAPGGTAHSLSVDPAPLSMTPDVYDLLAAADLALTKTGTTTVECAILGTPMVAAYRTGAFDFAIARTIVDVPFAAMPNLIAKRRVVPEFVQTAVTPEALATEAIALLTDDSANKAQREGLAEVKKQLGPPGAVQRAADVVEQWLIR